jgi:hypothetical protein
MTDNITIKGLNRADVLAALYDRARPLGLGYLHYTPEPMSRQEAETLLKQTTRFDYLKGRVMKVNLSGDDFNSRLYDRDNGDGAAAEAITSIKRG